MVTSKIKIYIVENDHRLQEYCEEKKVTPNQISLEDFISIADEIGWVMSLSEFERHYNTRTLPTYYFIRFKEDASTEGII